MRSDEIRRVPLVALLSALLGLWLACDRPKKAAEKERSASPSPTARRAPNSPDPLRPGSPTRAAADPVPARPLGAPTEVELLAFPTGGPRLHQWDRTPPWAGLPRSTLKRDPHYSRAAKRALKEGWSPEVSPVLEPVLRQQAPLLKALRKLPPCNSPALPWARLRLPLTPPASPVTTDLSELLGLSLRRHASLRRWKEALVDGLAALRLSCHLGQIPDVVQQIAALHVEKVSLYLLATLPLQGDACQRLRSALQAHAEKRLRMAHLGRSHWLLARANFQVLVRDLVRGPRVAGASKKRLTQLKRQILRRCSMRYARYSYLLRRSLKTGTPAAWQAFSRYADSTRDRLDARMRRHGAKSVLALAQLAAAQPNRPTAWTADVFSQVFLGMTMLPVKLWKGTYKRARDNRSALRSLAARCAPKGALSRPRPSAAPSPSRRP